MYIICARSPAVQIDGLPLFSFVLFGMVLEWKGYTTHRLTYWIASSLEGLYQVYRLEYVICGGVACINKTVVLK